MKKALRCSTISLWVATPVLVFASYSAFAENTALWRQQAQDLIDDGKTASALYILEDTATRLNEEPDALEQINRLRYLGSLYQQAGKPKLSAGYFEEAITRSLNLMPLRKRFPAVISVLKMHRKTLKNHHGLGALIQKTLDAELLTLVSRDADLEDINRYIKCWDNAANHSQLAQLLSEIREIRYEGTRATTLKALSKIETYADEPFLYLTKPTPHYDADALEKFYWQFILTRTMADRAESAEFEESLRLTTQLLEEVPQQKRSVAKKMLRKLTQ